MNSKEYLLNEAERLYVFDLNTVEEVASKLKISDKTVCRWKIKYDWEFKRKKYLKSKQCFHEEMYEFARKIMRDISSDMDAGEKVDAGRMYALCRILPMFTKVKDYEDIVAPKPKKETKKGLTADIIAQIEEEVLGIPRPQEVEQENDKTN